MHPTANLWLGAGYTLQLPKGSVYSALAGPLQREASVKFYGLRRFAIPLRQDFQSVRDLSQQQQIFDGAGYRRLDFWLPHALSSESKLDNLAKAISLCSYKDNAEGNNCQRVKFSLSRSEPGLFRMSVPTLTPRQLYRLSVQTSTRVHDGFNIPLTASDQTFWATDTGENSSSLHPVDTC